VLGRVIFPCEPCYGQTVSGRARTILNKPRGPTWRFVVGWMGPPSSSRRPKGLRNRPRSNTGFCDGACAFPRSGQPAGPVVGMKESKSEWWWTWEEGRQASVARKKPVCRGRSGTSPGLWPSIHGRHPARATCPSPIPTRHAHDEKKTGGPIATRSMRQA